MNSFEAFNRCRAATAKNSPMMVFDWDKAAEIIRDKKPETAKAGLRDDWEWTGGTIFENGDVVRDSYTFLASIWAVPELWVDGEIIPCYRLKDDTPGWDSDTKWPDSAISILKGETKNEVG